VSGPAELRKKLIAAATVEVDRAGIESVSLRTLASVAGVSRQAPYLCFADKRSLLAAVAAGATRRARLGWNTALARARPEPRARLCTLALTHARNALAHPELHELMYGSYVHKADDAELQREGIEAFRIVRDLVEQVQPSPIPVAELRRRTTLCWGAVHGLVDLYVKRQVPGSIEGTLESMVEAMVTTLCDGWDAPPVAQPSQKKRRKTARR
jgi:AcrR family transcriptional regulator